MTLLELLQNMQRFITAFGYIEGNSVCAACELSKRHSKGCIVERMERETQSYIEQIKFEFELAKRDI